MANQDHSLPTHAKQRLELLDIFRGFAIAGIFVANITIMNCTFPNQAAFNSQWTSITDKLAMQFLDLFVHSKFFPILSFMFGIGISILALKSLDASHTNVGFYLRRMGGLFIIGVLHVLLLWSGDVVHLYALLGVFILLFVKKSNKVILTWAFILLVFPFYNKIFDWLMSLLHFTPQHFLADYPSKEIIRVIRYGSYFEGMRLRVYEYMANIPLLYGYVAPDALPMFLLGLYVGKNKFLYSIDSLVDKLKKPLIFLTIIAFAYIYLILFEVSKYFPEFNEIAMLLLIRLFFVARVILGLFYLWVLAWLWRTSIGQKLLSPLKYAGQMALTNYILQSFLGLFLFTSIGFKLYETLSPTQTLFTALAIYGGQIMFSKLWLKHYYYGPLEWVWRCFSYQKVLPLRKKAVFEIRHAQIN